MKRRIALILILLLLWPARAGADGGFSADARAACLIDAVSGRILYAQNAHTRYPMASTTKIMTALLALENCDLDAPVTAGENASGVEGTSIYLSAGETLSMRNMLYGLMLRSGNDAAVAIAEHISGSAEAFAIRMTERAAQLGADAIFRNPHGLPADDHAATAYAMCQIAREAMQHETFRTIVSTRRATIPWVGNDFARVLNNKNKLLTDYPGATGIKTGFTKSAGRCLVFSAEKNGMSLIGCVLNCPDWFGEAARLLDYGFSTFSPKILLRAGEAATQIPVTNARTSTLPLTVAQDFVLPLTASEAYTLEITAPPAAAPITTGQPLGEAVIIIDGLPTVRVPLIASQAVPEWGLMPALRRIWRQWLLPK